jgi:GxxExxY protein
LKKDVTKSYLKDLVYQINSVAIEVYKTIGTGLLESVYHQCLNKEFEVRTISFKSELEIPISYKGFELQSKLRCDFIIEDL